MVVSYYELAREIATDLVARWEHGDEMHREWLRKVAIPDIINALLAWDNPRKESTPWPTDELLIDYIRREPSNIGHVASQFGVSHKQAHDRLIDLECKGKIRPVRRLRWELVPS